MFLVGLAAPPGAVLASSARFDEETKIKNSLLICFGLTLVLQNLAIRLWTADERGINTFYAGWAGRIAGVDLPFTRLGTLARGGAGHRGLHLFLTRTYLGKAIRATAEDWEAATLAGIDVRRTYLFTFALGTALAGIAGTLVSVGYASARHRAGLDAQGAGGGRPGGPGQRLRRAPAGLLLGLAEAASVLFIGGARTARSSGCPVPAGAADPAAGAVREDR